MTHATVGNVAFRIDCTAMISSNLLCCKSSVGQTLITPVFWATQFVSLLLGVRAALAVEAHYDDATVCQRRTRIHDCCGVWRPAVWLRRAVLRWRIADVIMARGRSRRCDDGTPRDMR